VEILPDGRLVVAGQRELLAGASLPLGVGISNVMRFAQLDLNTAVRMAVHNPASLLGLDPGGLDPGDPADLVQFDLPEPPDNSAPSKFELHCTVADGLQVSGTPWRP